MKCAEFFDQFEPMCRYVQLIGSSHCANEVAFPGKCFGNRFECPSNFKFTLP